MTPRSLHAALLTAAALLSLAPPLSTSAHAAGGDLEIALSPTLISLSSPTIRPLTAAPAAPYPTLMPTVRLGYGINDALDAFLGYRGLQPLSRTTTEGIVYATELSALIAGARVNTRLPGAWLRAYAQLEVELSAATLRVELDDLRRGSQTTWGAGVLPEVGLEACWRMDDRLALSARLGVGYALRLDHAFDDVRLSVRAAARVRPLDLGALNLSGLTFGWTFAAIF